MSGTYDTVPTAFDGKALFGLRTMKWCTALERSKEKRRKCVNRTLYIETHKRGPLGLGAPDVNRDDETTYLYTEAETASAMRRAQ